MKKQLDLGDIDGQELHLQFEPSFILIMCLKQLTFSTYFQQLRWAGNMETWLQSSDARDIVFKKSHRIDLRVHCQKFRHFIPLLSSPRVL